MPIGSRPTSHLSCSVAGEPRANADCVRGVFAGFFRGSYAVLNFTFEYLTNYIFLVLLAAIIGIPIIIAIRRRGGRA